MNTPSAAPITSTPGWQADIMIEKEIAGQDAMWGSSNERADSSKGQLLLAALAQANAVEERRRGNNSVFSLSHPFPYPEDWSGFRSYGGDIPNLVVAAAYLRQEIKRLIAAGEDPTRQPAQPFPQEVKPQDAA